MTSSTAPILLWFRKDLRLGDHPALSAAAATDGPIIPVYVLDDETPGRWAMGGASRWWLAQSLRALEAKLEGLGSKLILARGRADEVLLELARKTGAERIFFTRGYEPFQSDLELRLKTACDETGITCRRFGGQLLFEPEQIKNKAGAPFRVFTPFYKACLALPSPRALMPPPRHLKAPAHWPRSEHLAAWALEPTKPDWAGGLRDAWTCGEEAAQERLDDFIEASLTRYKATRDLPDGDHTSRLSPYLAFGEISPHQIWHAGHIAAEKSGAPGSGEPYLRQLIWREFSSHLLFHFPTLPEKAFRPEFDAFPWQDRYGLHLKAWQQGQTGYPIVDAGMRQLWQTGWMHNRVRMIVASFLCKHLLIPWQEGEAWFWDTLVDADLANNAASWQWVAGSGVDAAPYFRIFNPVLQGEKFDEEGYYVRDFCPELEKLPAALIHQPWQAPQKILDAAQITLGQDYPIPIVNHDEARQRALEAYRSLKSEPEE